MSEPSSEEKSRKDQLILWAKVLGVLLMILEGGFSSWKSTKAADGTVVKEISQEIYAKGEEALTKASVNEANVKVCFDQINLLRSEMNDKSLKFAELVVQLAQNNPSRYREETVVPLSGSPPAGRRAGGSAPHPPSAAGIQRKIDTLAPPLPSPIQYEKGYPRAEKGDDGGKMQRLYDKL